jgi:hypothetical protein
MIRFDCPKCKQPLRHPTAPAEVTCPYCGRLIRTPHYEPHRGKSILLMTVFGLFTLPFIFGPILLKWGHDDLSKMEDGAMDPAGRLSTEIGFACSIVATTVSLFLLAAVAVLHCTLLAVILDLLL